LALEVEILGARHATADMLDPELQRWFGVHAASGITAFLRGHRPARDDLVRYANDASTSSSQEKILSDAPTLAETMHASL